MRPKKSSSKSPKEKEFDERVLEVARISRVVQGGRRLRFRVLVVAGDHKGRVGMGIGKANEVSGAVTKATNRAKKNLITVPIIKGTIPYEIIATYGASKIMLKPASPGTSIVAGGSVRNVVEVAGITDILTKVISGKSSINNVSAITRAFQSFNPLIVERIRNFESKSANKEKSQKASINQQLKAENNESAKKVK